MATTETPPPIQAPTAKEKKYDRQLRLWAATGQRALEESHILLVIPDQGDKGSGSSVAGIETLKNLVLPGIGAFTIADSANVTEADLGINFFLEADSLDKPRAEESARLVGELNPDVTGHSINQNLEERLTDPTELRKYSLILLCEPSSPTIRRSICAYTREHKIPLLSLRSVGFYSTFSVQVPSEFPIVDTHPDPDSIQDLRLLAPWPELSAEVSALGDLSVLSDHDHGHVPYVLLLLHYLEGWKKSHSGKYPDTFKEKTQFRDLVRAGARTSNAEGGEENFDEAAGAVLKTITPPAIGAGCREMFEVLDSSSVNQRASNFWSIASAIKSFYKKHGVLPLPGSLPDMKARSADYVKLQNIYKSKARRDVAEVTATVRSLQGPNNTTPAPDAEIEAFCKNAAHVKIVLGTPLPSLSGPGTPDADDLSRDIFSARLKSLAKSSADNEDSLLPIWLALQLLGSDPSSLTDLPTGIVENCRSATAELDRASGGEMHNISSICGGMVAQECIKIITRQYVPVDNTCIFDGIQGKTEVIRL